MRGGPFLLLPLLASLACGEMAASRTDVASAGAVRGSPPLDPPSGTLTINHGWADVTRSPSALEPGAGGLHDLRERVPCESPGLARVARELAERRARGLGLPDSETVVTMLRAAGEPHVRPRVIVATGKAPIDETKVWTQLAVRPELGDARCGVAIAKTAHGGEVLVAVSVDVLADLSPLPTRARTGEWLSFEARIHVPTHAAKLIVLGPRGAPRTVPTSLDPATGTTRARFVLDQPGAFTVQLVGDVARGGPRPLLEARVFADIVPPLPGEEPSAPGEEDSPREGTSPEDALARMVAALRVLEGLPAVSRDAKLDALARVHAERMRDRQAVAHDLGDGDFRDRFEAEGTLGARAVGENVAHAPTVALAHRALHASPSHRINLLRADYTHLGIGVANAPDGGVYVCETFAARR